MDGMGHVFLGASKHLGFGVIGGIFRPQKHTKKNTFSGGIYKTRI